MENASKALIIAGAILISILLISVGIIIMNAINNPVQQSVSSADAQAIQSFNAEYLNYEGTQTGATIRGLIASVNAHNATDPDNGVGINADYSKGTKYSTANITNFNANTRYTVTMNYGNDGRINKITIANPTSST